MEDENNASDSEVLTDSTNNNGKMPTTSNTSDLVNTEPHGLWFRPKLSEFPENGLSVFIGLKKKMQLTGQNLHNEHA